MPEIFHSPEIVVVEASAGSGKTYALAQRYVRLILHLSREEKILPPVHSILAITFTNKAAAEMKERILRFLKLLALDRMPAGDRAALLTGLGLSDEEARRIALRVMDAVLSGYNYFQVQTIDRFIRTLLAGSAFAIGLGGAFRIRTDDREYLEEALDEMIDEAGTNAVLRRDFEDFLTGMLLVESRVSWVPRDVVLDTITKLFGDYNSFGTEFRSPTVSPEDIWKFKSRLVARIRDFADKIPEGVNQTFAKGVLSFTERHKKAFRFGNLGKSFTNETIRMKKGYAAPPELEDLWQEIHQGFRRVADLEMKHCCDPYVKLFIHARERFNALGIRDDVVFLSQLNVRAADLRGVSPLEMYYRLSTRFEHYLFDEFQDTSLLQWDNLKALPEDALALGGSLFYVGDKKQAIYSFRGGDTRLFDAIRGAYQSAHYAVDDRSLEVNYRSQPAIVAFNNAVFSMENLEGFLRGACDGDNKPFIPAREEDFAELRRVYSRAAQHAAAENPGGVVRVESIGGGSAGEARELSLQRTIEILRSLEGRGFRWKDMAVLVRKNSEVSGFTRGLLESGIPASSDRTLNIKEHVHVEEMMALLRFLESPVDDEAFAMVVQGELFLKAAGLLVDDIRDFMLEWRQDRGAGYLYRSFADRFPSAWTALLEPFFRQVGLVPLYELLSSIYRGWGVLENFSSSRAFLMHLLGLVQVKETDYPGVAAFLAHYDALDGEELYVPADDANAVTITTVHRSKGLDFNIVILPSLAFNARREQGRGEKAVSYTLRCSDDELVLYHFNKEHGEYSDQARAEYIEDQMRHFFAELNTVYVALTRARWEMYVLMPSRAGNAVNLAPWLIPSGQRAVGDACDHYGRREEGAAVMPEAALPPRCLDWLEFLREEFVSREPAAVEKDRAFGSALHIVLEHLGTVSEGGEQAALDQALAFLPEGVSRADVATCLLDLITTPAVMPFFSIPEANVRTEYEIVDRFGNTRRLDRVLIAPEAVTVLDFKTSRADDLDTGLRQVSEYKQLLGGLFPGRRVTGKLVFVREREVLDV